MKIVDEFGRSPEMRVREILRQFKGKLDKSNRVISIAIADSIKKHFQSIYPGSKHYAPEKVKVTADNEVVVDVPGISRALHDLNIRPKNGKYLTIPLHRSAYGISARDVDGLFYAKNKNGTEMLAKNEGGALVVMYILKTQVHQARNPNLLPSRQAMFSNIISRLRKYLDQ